MTYPPKDCTYQVLYQVGRRGRRATLSFDDEFTMMIWFKQMSADGMFDPETFAMPDEDGRNGYQILCVAEGQEPTPISYRHPRMIQARFSEQVRAAASD